MYYVTSLNFLLQYQALIFSELARRMDPAVGVCEDGDAGDAGDDSICSMGQPSSSGQDGMGWSHVKPGIWDLTSEIFASGENITPLSSKSRDWYKPQKSQKSHNKVRQHFDVCLFCSFWCFWIWHFKKNQGVETVFVCMFFIASCFKNASQQTRKRGTWETNRNLDHQHCLNPQIKFPNVWDFKLVYIDSILVSSRSA